MDHLLQKDLPYSCLPFSKYFFFPLHRMGGKLFRKKKKLCLQKFETLEMENAEQGEESLHKRPCAVWKMVCPSCGSFFVLELGF